MKTFKCFKTVDGDFEGNAGDALFYIQAITNKKYEVEYCMDSWFFRTFKIMNLGSPYNLFYFGSFKNLEDAESELKNVFCKKSYFRYVKMANVFRKSIFHYYSKKTKTRLQMIS